VGAIRRYINSPLNIPRIRVLPCTNTYHRDCHDPRFWKLHGVELEPKKAIDLSGLIAVPTKYAYYVEVVKSNIKEWNGLVCHNLYVFQCMHDYGECLIPYTISWFERDGNLIEITTGYSRSSEARVRRHEMADFYKGIRA
jgi:hypothetical protein